MNFFKSTLSLIGLFLIFALAPAKLSFAQNNDNSFRAVENMPELHGSLDSLQKQIDYPDEALDKKVEGTVIVQLIVNKKGQAESPRVLRGIGAGCDKEALRVVKKAQFSPGVQRGQKVRVQYTVPVKFEIKMPPPPQSEQPSGDVLMTAEQMPRLYGSKDSLHKQIKYPDEAIQKGIEGRVTVQFIVTESGQVENPEVIRGIGSGCDKEALRIIKQAQFTPAQHRGKNVSVRRSLSINFELQKDRAMDPPKEKASQDKEENVDAYKVVEQMPQLKGGMDRIMEEIEYPEMARKASVEGRVVVKAIIEKDGSISSPEVIRGIGAGCDKEALRVVEELSFEPGRHNGKPVRVQYSIVVPFRLQN